MNVKRLLGLTIILASLYFLQVGASGADPTKSQTHPGEQEVDFDPRHANPDLLSAYPESYSVGDKVEARCKNQSGRYLKGWYKATITKKITNAEGEWKYKVKFDDGIKKYLFPCNIQSRATVAPQLPPKL